MRQQTGGSEGMMQRMLLREMRLLQRVWCHSGGADEVEDGRIERRLRRDDLADGAKRASSLNGWPLNVLRL